MDEEEQRQFDREWKRRRETLEMTRRDTRLPITLEMRIIGAINETGQTVESYFVAGRADANGLVYVIKTRENAEACVRPHPVGGVVP